MVCIDELEDRVDVGFGDLALAAELGEHVGPPRRRGLLRSFLDGAPGVGRGVLALVARDRVREPAVADELRGARLEVGGQALHAAGGSWLCRSHVVSCV